MERLYSDWSGPAELGRRVEQPDIERIVESPFFRRLNGVSQVASALEIKVFENRLTHSLEVARIGKRIAAALNARLPRSTDRKRTISEASVEAACLAHDLGHPPFGHTGEAVLDECLRGAGVADGFDGNAQTFRILTRLARRDMSYAGLNLSIDTLNGVLKYPWIRNCRNKKSHHYRKWSVYNDDKDTLTAIRDRTPQISRSARTIEAQIMDLADDIAYSVHDVEDFIPTGLIPIYALVPQVRSGGLTRVTDPAAQRPGITLARAAPQFTELDEINPADANLSFGWTSEALKFVNAVLESRGFVGYFSDHGLSTPTQAQILAALARTLGPFFVEGVNYDHSPKARAQLRWWRQEMIDRFTLNVGIQKKAKGHVLVMDGAADIELQIMVLKQLTWRYVHSSESLLDQQLGEESVIKGLFGILLDVAIGARGRPDVFPHPFKDAVLEARRGAFGDTTSVKRRCARVVADYIAFMTEAQAFYLHERLSGMTQGSMLDTPPI